MLTLKRIDTYGQVIVLAVAIFWAFFAQLSLGWLLGYFVLGTWQLLSVLAHWAWSSHWPLRSGRLVYSRVLFVLLITGLLSVFLYPGFFLFLLLPLVAGPLLAVWYISISFKELAAWEMRTLIRWR